MSRGSLGNGFSLVELSIVLVILGLLTGGILAGQSLIRAAELRAIPTEIARFTGALQTFRGKYMALPGDMPNATVFWGTATSCPGDHTTPSTDTATCNGNGSGTIDYYYCCNPDGSAKPATEHVRVWQQLAAAGLIEGSYTGVPANGTSTTTYSEANTPPSKLAAAFWELASYNLRSGADPYWWEGAYNNQLYLSKRFNGGAILTPAEAWNIDTKLDDGKPAYGTIRSRRNSTNCNTTTLETTADYNLAYTSQACTLTALPLR